MIHVIGPDRFAAEEFAKTEEFDWNEWRFVATPDALRGADGVVLFMDDARTLPCYEAILDVILAEGLELLVRDVAGRLVAV